ncbi:hypothetical protein CCACVL1_02282, partial [Corchorus capsularis]
VKSPGRRKTVERDRKESIRKMTRRL